MANLTYKEISKINELVESELIRMEARQKKESSFRSVGSIIDKAEDEKPLEWDLEDKRLEMELSTLNAIKDKINQLFERINFTFGVDNNRFNQQPNKENLPSGQ